MATSPTVELFLVRFPEFADRDSALIQMLLDEAAGDVGETWLPNDRTPATLYLAAHLLAIQGTGVPGVGGGAAVTGPIKKRTVGDVEVEFGNMTASRDAKGLAAAYGRTAYGSRYYELMRRNFPAVAVV